MSIVVYSKANCPQCTATISQLKKKDHTFEVKNVEEDTSAYNRVSELGYRQLPVVETPKEHWAGFRPDKIGGLAAAL